MHRWFVVASYSKWEHHRTHSEKVPLAEIHAKEMGTHTTACGLPCDNWMKWWEHPFPTPGKSACPRCVAIVGRMGLSSAAEVRH